MNHKHVEPRIGRVDLFKLDLSTLKRVVESLVADAAEAVQGEACRPLFQQDRRDHDVVDLVLLAKVVEEAGRVEDVEGAQTSLLATIAHD